MGVRNSDGRWPYLLITGANFKLLTFICRTTCEHVSLFVISLDNCWSGCGWICVTEKWDRSRTEHIIGKLTMRDNQVPEAAVRKRSDFNYIYLENIFENILLGLHTSNKKYEKIWPNRNEWLKSHEE